MNLLVLVNAMLVKMVLVNKMLVMMDHKYMMVEIMVLEC